MQLRHSRWQVQRGSFGFLADCVWIFLRESGKWRSECWDLIESCADYITNHWRRRDSGIWELASKGHVTSSKVMSWVTLDRAVKIAEVVNGSFDTTRWRDARLAIHKDVLRLKAFRQGYGKDNLDAAVVLIPVMDFLPAKDWRVLATIQRMEESLMLDGFVYRFIPEDTPGVKGLPLGEFEGAFLPCTFWLATAYAKAGFYRKSEAILDRVEKISGDLGLLAEAIDPRTGTFLGNSPLRFSHVEYIRAVLKLGELRRR